MLRWGLISICCLSSECVCQVMSRLEKRHCPDSVPWQACWEVANEMDELTTGSPNCFVTEHAPCADIWTDLPGKHLTDTVSSKGFPCAGTSSVTLGSIG